MKKYRLGNKILITADKQLKSGKSRYIFKTLDLYFIENYVSITNVDNAFKLMYLLRAFLHNDLNSAKVYEVDTIKIYVGNVGEACFVLELATFDKQIILEKYETHELLNMLNYILYLEDAMK